MYQTAGPVACSLVDVALAKGGPEAIAESFYACMRNQIQPGGQLNDTLATRSKIAWCLPSLDHCEHIIKEAVALYHNGDRELKPYLQNTFFSSRAKKYNVSKVVDRLNTDKGRCPFLASEH